MSILIQQCNVLDTDAPRAIAVDRAILIRGNRIAAIGAPDEVAPLAEPDALCLDGRNLLAIPGLISAHTHSPENYMRGATERMPLEPWLVWLYGTCG
ncbi:MAG: amidohydrolase, partial [Anaerolineae bacterium]|nr:hypothetical protein [Thermoflexales bacterium]MDW8408967.1 amidohydrolase [Anaerolineae bacterium]